MDYRGYYGDSEILETAKQLWIQNFYKSKNKKLNTVSFQSVKEEQPSRNITQLHHESEVVRIVQIMQD
jgi:hypothetical protein